jgi:hypothetical protein
MSTSQGTLVSLATLSVTAPATPKQADSMPRHVARAQELADHAFETVVRERGELADLDGGGTLWRGCEEAQQRLRSADVPRQQHHGPILVQ